MESWISSILQGILLGGLYGLFAAGLSLVFGVMRLVNVAHGDFIVLSAFLAGVAMTTLGIHSPLLAAGLTAGVMFGVGYLVQRLLLNRVLGDDILRPVLVTFGLSVIIQNGLLWLFSADAQRLQAGNIEVASIPLFGDMAVGVFPALIFAICVAVVASLQWMLYRTPLGRKFRATSDDPVTAGMMGINDKHLFGIATAIAMAVVAVAGVLMGIRSSFDPSTGPEQLIFAFEAVIVGGLGSLWGTLAGGVILGIAQTIGARLSPDWQILAGHITFLAILMVKPGGLFPKRKN